MGLKLPSTEKRIAKQPFLLLGFGINSYFDIMEQMCKMFCTISVFFVPIMLIYMFNKQEALYKQGGMAYMGSAISIGNLGGAKVYCHQNLL